MLRRLAARLPFYYGWIVVAVVFITMAVGVNARTAFSLFFPPILEEFGWDRGVTAGAFSFGFLISAFLSPPLGRLMDARGPRWVSLIGIVITGGGLLLATLATQPWHFYLTLGVLVGAGSVCLGYSCQALFLPAWFERRRGLASSIAFSGVGLGSIFLLPLLQQLIDTTGWRSACIALGSFALIALGPLALLLERRPQNLGLLPDGQPAPQADQTSQTGQGAQTGQSRQGTPSVKSAAASATRPDPIVDRAWTAIEWTLARALRTARFWWLALGYFSGLFAWYMVQVHQTKYLVEIGFDATEAAFALGFVALVGIPGQIALGQLSDRAGREIVWTLGSLGFVLTYAALIVLQTQPSPALMWFMVIVQGALGYSLTSVFGAIPLEIFEGPHYGSIFGTLMFAAISGGAVGPLVAGLVHDLTGTYTGAWWMGIGSGLLAMVCIWIAAPRKVRLVAGQAERRAAQAVAARG
ncbi:MAG: MFS transporter [Burkholderiaceae bacterium]